MFTGALDDPNRFDVIPLSEETSHVDNDSIPQVVNSVATVKFFPTDDEKQTFNIPLQTLAMNLPVSQYKPSAFSSVIMRVNDGEDTFTVLFFNSGKVVCVRCKSPNHSAVVSHKVRLLLSDIPVVIKNVETGATRIDTLGKYIDFLDWCVQNVVLTGNFGFRIKLEELATAFSQYIKYCPGGFPGAEGIFNVKPESACTCTKQSKCGCKAKVLFFDSGKVIIAGPKDVRPGIRLFRELTPLATVFRDDGAVTSRDERYEMRIRRFAEFLKKNANCIQPKKRGRKKKQKKEEEEEEEENVSSPHTLTPEEEEESLHVAIEQTMTMLSRSKNYQVRFRSSGEKRLPHYSNDVTDLMKACEQGLLNTVKILVESNMEDVHQKDAQGNTAVDRLKLSGIPESNPIVRYLMKRM
jgi:TATA-box binding protein (TBP) (component of TFIID and TFIIIB)